MSLLNPQSQISRKEGSTPPNFDNSFPKNEDNKKNIEKTNNFIDKICNFFSKEYIDSEEFKRRKDETNEEYKKRKEQLKIVEEIRKDLKIITKTLNEADKNVIKNTNKKNILQKKINTIEKKLTKNYINNLNARNLQEKKSELQELNNKFNDAEKELENSLNEYNKLKQEKDTEIAQLQGKIESEMSTKYNLDVDNLKNDINKVYNYHSDNRHHPSLTQRTEDNTNTRNNIDDINSRLNEKKMPQAVADEGFGNLSDPGFQEQLPRAFSLDTSVGGKRRYTRRNTRRNKRRNNKKSKKNKSKKLNRKSRKSNYKYF